MRMLRLAAVFEAMGRCVLAVRAFFPASALCLALLATPSLDAKPLQRLRVADNHRYLVREDGSPFFYLGDTAWELFHRLNREEVGVYLENRAEKGFTVIQAVVLAELDGVDEPNAYGHLPLMGNDPARPRVRDGPANDYWDHVDYVVDRAASLGLYVGMLPAWGNKWWTDQPDRPGVFDPDNALAYGRWLGARYKDEPIIWVLGGDRNIRSDVERRIIDALAEGLRSSVGASQLMTYHPRGPGRSAELVHDAEWLDFNMFQSSHAAKDHDNGLFAIKDYGLDPPKPTLDGEPRYEQIVTGFYFQPTTDRVRFDDFDVRQAAYWSLLAGACGHTYGNANVWQMWDHGRSPVLDATIPWSEAIDHPGAFQMTHVRHLFEAYPFHTLTTDESFVVDGPSRGAKKVRGMISADRSFAFVYSPYGRPFSLDLSAFSPETLRETWYDPRYGVHYEMHWPESVGIQTYVPPTRGRGQDWVLVIDEGSVTPHPLRRPLSFRRE